MTRLLTDAEQLRFDTCRSVVTLARCCIEVILPTVCVSIIGHVFVLSQVEQLLAKMLSFLHKATHLLVSFSVVC